jgi:anti-anti-sigma factor
MTAGLPTWRTRLYTVVQLPDQIDTSNADEVRERLLALLNSGGSDAGPVIVDLTGTTFCDSSAINALLRTRTRASALGRRLYAAVAPGGIVRKIFDITAVSRVISVADDVGSAIAMAVETSLDDQERPSRAPVKPSADDGPAGRVLADLLQRSHLMAPADLADYLTEAARPLGISGVRIFLADLEQHQLQALPGGFGRAPSSLVINSTLAGRAFQTITVQRPAAGKHPDGRRLWIPLVDGTERLGVMEVSLAEENGPAEAERPPGGDGGQTMLERCRMLGSFAGLVIAAKSVYSDSFARIQRSREMSLQAEMVWAFMAPRTFATSKVLLAAALEPAYEVGGDAFDYSLLGEHLHVSIFDSVGHDLTAGLISSVAMAACRSVRRSGGDLTELATRADQAIAGQFGASRFATALLCDLDTLTGEFTWIPCGHPPPLLIRDSKVIKELHREPRLPLGLTEDRVEPAVRAAFPVYTEQLQPHDRLLLYTDGVTDARTAEDRMFGLARLGDFVIRHSAEGLPAPETLRRLNRTIVDYQQGRVRDDATVVLLEWMPRHPDAQLTA